MEKKKKRKSNFSYKDPDGFSTAEETVKRWLK